MTEYVHIELMIEKETLRALKDITVAKCLVGKDDIQTEAFKKIIDGIKDKKNIVELILKSEVKE